MGLRREVKGVALAILEKSRRYSEIFMTTGQAFMTGIINYREECFGDPTYVGSRPPANISEEEYRVGEFSHGIRAVKRFLGFEGPSYTGMDIVGKEYIGGLRELEEEIETTSIGNCAMLILRNQYPFCYAPGEVAKGYAVFGRLLSSDYFLRRLEHEQVADSFYECLFEVCKAQKPSQMAKGPGTSKLVKA